MGRKKKINRRSLVDVDVLDAVAYVDSVVLVLPQRLPEAIHDRLYRSVESAQTGRCFSEKINIDEDFYFYKLNVHQPTLESMAALKAGQKTPYRARLLEVHIALDLIVRSQHDAVALQRYFEERFLPSSRLKKMSLNVHGTTYYNRGTRKGVEVKLYSDRPSKAVEAPCLHIEWRIVSSETLKNMKLVTISRVERLDFKKFCGDRIKLCKTPTAEILAKARNGMLGSKTPKAVGSEANQLAAREIIAKAHGFHQVVVAHDLLQLLRKSEVAPLI